jgi:SHS2 domain-containing protein
MIFKPDTAGYAEIEHTADVGILVRGSSLEQLFANALFGMYYTLFGHITVPYIDRSSVKLSEPCLEDLLVAWLSEMNYNLQTNRFLAGEIRRISITRTKDSFNLKATLAGDKSEKYMHLLQTEIKAVTYHQLQVIEKNGTYTARLIFDI